MQIADEGHQPQPLLSFCKRPCVFASLASTPSRIVPNRATAMRRSRTRAMGKLTSKLSAYHRHPALGHCFSAGIWAEKRQEFNAFNRLKSLNNPC